jgi:hypothetical protein
MRIKIFRLSRASQIGPHKLACGDLLKRYGSEAEAAVFRWAGWTDRVFEASGPEGHDVLRGFSGA